MLERECAMFFRSQNNASHIICEDRFIARNLDTHLYAIRNIHLHTDCDNSSNSPLTAMTGVLTSLSLRATKPLLLSTPFYYFKALWGGIALKILDSVCHALDT